MPKNIFDNAYLFWLGFRSNSDYGLCFHHGSHVKKDLKLARMYYLQAIKKKEGSEFVFYQFSKLAEEEGLPGESFYYLGRQHEWSSKWQDALSSYKCASEENYVLALYRAGLLFKEDRPSHITTQSIKKDLAMELMWYRKAVTAGSKEALDELIALSKEQSKAALCLAQMYEKGEIANKKSLSSAVEYYKKASNLGDPIATNRLRQLEGLENLDSLFEDLENSKDQKIPEDPEVPKKRDPLDFIQKGLPTFKQKPTSFKSSATPQDPNVQKNQKAPEVIESTDSKLESLFQLGFQYQYDNKEKAFDCFIKAAQLGHPEAFISLERLGIEMDPDRQLQIFNLYRIPNQHKALYWCQQAIQSSYLQGLELNTEIINQLLETKQDINLRKLSQMFQASTQQESKNLFGLFNR